jgi:hypothetical protein
VIDISITGVEELSADFLKALAEAPNETRSVVAKGCLNVKNSWRSKWSGFKHAPALPLAVTYDVTTSSDGVRGEIGPERGKRQAPLDVILEYGTRKNAPHPGGIPSANEEEPRFVQAMEDLAARLLNE